MCFPVRALERFLCKYFLSCNYKVAFPQWYLRQAMLIADPVAHILPSSLNLSSVLKLGSHLFQGSPSQAGQRWEWGEELVFIRLSSDVNFFPLTGDQCVLLDRRLAAFSSLFNSDLVQELGSSCLWMLRGHGFWTCYSHHETKRGRIRDLPWSQPGTLTFSSFWIYQLWNQISSKCLALWNNNSRISDAMMNWISYCSLPNAFQMYKYN